MHRCSLSSMTWSVSSTTGGKTHEFVSHCSTLTMRCNLSDSTCENGFADCGTENCRRNSSIYNPWQLWKMEKGRLVVGRWKKRMEDGEGGDKGECKTGRITWSGVELCLPSTFFHFLHRVWSSSIKLKQEIRDCPVSVLPKEMWDASVYLSVWATDMTLFPNSKLFMGKVSSLFSLKISPGFLPNVSILGGSEVASLILQQI